MQSITVQKLWPLEGKPNGGFKGTDGKAYKCDAATYGRLQEGMTFESNVKPSDWQGKTFYWLPKNFTPDNTVGAIIPQPDSNGRMPPSPPMTGYATNATQRYVDKDVLITTTALMKSFIETGQFSTNDLSKLEGDCIQAARSIVKRSMDGLS